MRTDVALQHFASILRVAPISLVVTHQYVNPLVAIALGMLFLNERPSPWSLAGMSSAPAAASTRRISAARAGTSVPAVRTPTHTSPAGSWRWQRSSTTHGIRSVTTRA